MYIYIFPFFANDLSGVKISIFNRILENNSPIKAAMRQQTLITLIYRKNINIPNYFKSHACRYHAFTFNNESINMSETFTRKKYFISGSTIKQINLFDTKSHSNHALFIFFLSNFIIHHEKFWTSLSPTAKRVLISLNSSMTLFFFT